MIFQQLYRVARSSSSSLLRLAPTNSSTGSSIYSLCGATKTTPSWRPHPPHAAKFSNSSVFILPRPISILQTRSITTRSCRIPHQQSSNPRLITDDVELLNRHHPVARCRVRFFSQVPPPPPPVHPQGEDHHHHHTVRRDIFRSINTLLDRTFELDSVRFSLGMLLVLVTLGIVVNEYREDQELQGKNPLFSTIGLTGMAAASACHAIIAIPVALGYAKAMDINLTLWGAPIVLLALFGHKNLGAIMAAIGIYQLLVQGGCGTNKDRQSGSSNNNNGGPGGDDGAGDSDYRGRKRRGALQGAHMDSNHGTGKNASAMVPNNDDDDDDNNNNNTAQQPRQQQPQQ